MRGRFHPVILLVAIIPASALLILFLMLVIGFFRWNEPDIGMAASAALKSPDGVSIGSVKLTQLESGVVVAVDVRGLAEGGHSVSINEVGVCDPDFSAAGDHFDPSNSKSGFISLSGLVSPSWGKGSHIGQHGGDLPNIYASPDGQARADFFTNGIILDTNVRGSVFDADGSSVVISEKPSEYGEEETDTGARIACGVIERN